MLSGHTQTNTAPALLAVLGVLLLLCPLVAFQPPSAVPRVFEE